MALFNHLQMTASRFDIAHEETTVQQAHIDKKVTSCIFWERFLCNLAQHCYSFFPRGKKCKTSTQLFLLSILFRSTVSSTSQCSINSPFLYNNNLQLSSSSGGTLKSPSYPSNYPNNMMCTWRITAPSGSRLQLTFNYFRLESSPCSTRDYLEVRDGSSSTSATKGTYCGSNAPSITSSGRYLWIRFRSDFSFSYKGFDARYTIVTAPRSKFCFSSVTMILLT